MSSTQIPSSFFIPNSFCRRWCCGRVVVVVDISGFTPCPRPCSLWMARCGSLCPYNCSAVVVGRPKASRRGSRAQKRALTPSAREGITHCVCHGPMYWVSRMGIGSMTTHSQKSEISTLTLSPSNTCSPIVQGEGDGIAGMAARRSTSDLSAATASRDGLDVD